MTQRRRGQIDLFQSIDPPRTLPIEIEAQALALLVQLVQSMIPTMEAEVADEQDLH